MKETDKIVASDDMYTLRRQQRRWSTGDSQADLLAFAKAQQQEAERDFEAELRHWEKALEAELMETGWPPFSACVEVYGDRQWRHNPGQSLASIRARNEAGERVSLMRGETFIEKHVEPLSDDYFRWRLIRTIERVREEQNLQQKLVAAFELGRLQEIWKARRAFRKGFEAGRKAIEGGKRGTAERNAALAPEIQARLARMEQLMGEGHTIDRAADLAARDGFGSGKEANRRLWYRHRRKL